MILKGLRRSRRRRGADPRADMTRHNTCATRRRNDRYQFNRINPLTVGAEITPGDEVAEANPT